MLKRLIFPILAVCAVFAPLSARADVASDITAVRHSVMGLFSILTPEANDPAPAPAAALPATEPRTVAAPSLTAPTALTQIDLPSLPAASAAALPEPSVETPLHRLFCVEYARARSGLAVFGDAKFWWSRAQNLYARLEQPAEDAVMVFSGSKRLKRGHVAVVTNIVSPREIRVDQANWENHGEIDHATPVLDVSSANDWSLVRVWDMRSRTFGAHIYPVSGFIAKELTKQASRD